MNTHSIRVSTKNEQGEDIVLTEDLLRKAFADFGSPQRYYYPIHPIMWDAFLEAGYTEKALQEYGFLKTVFIE